MSAVIASCSRDYRGSEEEEGQERVELQSLSRRERKVVDVSLSLTTEYCLPLWLDTDTFALLY